MELLNLPIEMLHFILNKLVLPDLVRSRLVSKKFKTLIDNLSKKKLIVFYEGTGFSYFSAEFETNFDLRNSFKSPTYSFGFFESLSFKQFFKNLKNLSIVSTYENGKFNLNLINEFPGLEKLLLSPFSIDANLVLDHPGLKYFSILRNYKTSDFRFTLPKKNIKIVVESKVEHLELHLNYNFIEFVYPENVLSLEILDTGKIINFTELSNLKSLSVSHRSIEKLNIRTIEKFRSLDEFFVDSYYIFGFIIDIDKVKASSKKEIMKFLKELVNLKFNKGLRIKIYYFGIEIVKPLDAYKCSEISLQLFNYRLLTDNLFHRKFIRFNRLMKFINKYENLFDGLPANQLNPKLPADFFRKYNNIKKVLIEGLKDENEFFNFLSQCKLNHLTIYESKLSQNFLNNLPSICGNTLLNLDLEKTTNKTDEEFDFEFVFRLNYIQRLKTTSELSFEFALKLLIDSRWFLTIDFKSKGKSIQLWYYPTPFVDGIRYKDARDFFCREELGNRFINPEDFFFQFNYDQLVDHLKKDDIKPFRSYTKLLNGKSCVIHGAKDLNMEFVC